MADPKQSPELSKDSSEEIEDAVIVEDEQADPTEPGTDAAEAEILEADESETEDVPAEPDAAEEEAEPEPELSEAEESPETETPEPAVTRRGGFWPALLGGVVAAGIGAGGALVLFPQGLSGDDDAEQVQLLQSQLDEQAKQIGDLAGKVGGLVLPPDLSGDFAEVSKGVQQNADRLQQLAAQIAGIEERMANLEMRPVTEFASKEVVSAYEAELRALQQAMASQRSEIEEMLAEAESKKADAAESAREAKLRGVLARIRIALDSGGSFADPLSELELAGAEVPGGLKRAVDGVPTVATLREAFPDAARAALRASRDTETGGGVLTFLRDQLGVRSLEPREGADPDAVLSRAEAALKAGHLNDAIAELQALPEQGRVELTDWMALAAVRADALAAVEALSQQLMSN
ncbi:MAG: hypothetical protein R3256_00810 [Thalassovita sp.]|nr:hypothetical protein [Thalassovita sp.]